MQILYRSNTWYSNNKFVQKFLLNGKRGHLPQIKDFSPPEEFAQIKEKIEQTRLLLREYKICMPVYHEDVWCQKEKTFTYKAPLLNWNNPEEVLYKNCFHDYPNVETCVVISFK